MHLIKPPPDFYELIGNENIDDISLTIYYASPSYLTLLPWTVDILISGCDDKIVVNGNDLEEHIDLFKEISSDDWIPVKKKSSYVDVRLYYVLESKEYGKIIDVAMWGGDSHRGHNSIIVNDIEILGADIFYDVIMPFLPEDVAEDFEKFKN